MADIVKQAGEAERIETLMDPAAFNEPDIRTCAGCGYPCAANAMFTTPAGAMCRTCRDANYGAPAPAEKPPAARAMCPARPDRAHDISMRGTDGIRRCWFCVRSRAEIETGQP